MKIENLGYNIENYFYTDSNKLRLETARVISVNKESFIINNGKQELFTKLTGNLLYSAETAEDFPTVGDFVLFQNFEDDSLAIIHKVLPRKSLLKRKSAGKKVEYQLIAANVDFAIIIQALDQDFNPKRLERYLAMANEFEIEPIILFSKADLINNDQKDEILADIQLSLKNYQVISFSNFDKRNIENIRKILEPRKTYCLIGSSGVGKTTLLNNLLGTDKFKVNEIRENDSKGKHTTTARQLIVLENGAMIIDTPGMRELANISLSEGIEITFDEIAELTKDCKFSDCTHTVEKGCAVLEALENGRLDEQRYNNFIKLKKESEYFERTYLESRRRDKQFGKMVKSITKNNDKRKM
jgi:ribosome biogenesis GTPase